MPAHSAKDGRSTDHGIFPLLRAVVRAWLHDNAMRLSAALSLYTALCLAPLMLITFKVVDYVLRNKEHAQAQIMRQLSNLMGPQAAEAVRPVLESGGKGGHGTLAAIISLVVLAFSATTVFGELQSAMNSIWAVQPKPNQGIWGLVRGRLLSMSMVFGCAFLLLVSMFISAALTALAKFIANDTRWLAFFGDVLVSFAVVTLLFAAIFKFLPNATISWRHVWTSALLTAALFIVGKYILALYFRYAAPTSAFGAAGSLVAVLLWVYYSAFILFFGAEFTKVWAQRHGQQIMPSRHAQRAVGK